MKRRKGFTLIELMVVILIVGILAAVAIPILRGRIDAAKWSEGKAMMGSIGTAIRAYHAEKRNLEYVGGIADRLGDMLHPRRHAVKRSMGLDVVERHAFGLEKTGERADLINKAIGHLFPRHFHFPPAEPLQIGQRRMGADLYAVLLGEPNGLAHMVEVGSVKAACDIGYGNKGHKPRVIAHAVKPEGLTHVAIQSNRHDLLSPPRQMVVPIVLPW